MWAHLWKKTMKEIPVQVWKTLLVSCFSRQVPGTILFPVRLANLAIQWWALVYASLPWKPIPPCLLCAYLYWLIFSCNTPANIIFVTLITENNYNNYAICRSLNTLTSNYKLCCRSQKHKFRIFFSKFQNYIVLSRQWLR